MQANMHKRISIRKRVHASNKYKRVHVSNRCRCGHISYIYKRMHISNRYKCISMCKQDNAYTYMLQILSPYEQYIYIYAAECSLLRSYASIMLYISLILVASAIQHVLIWYARCNYGFASINNKKARHTLCGRACCCFLFTSIWFFLLFIF